ncbi:ABC transporter substrate-binding protein [Actinoalloteichus hymeniacidonis]|uniref:ABC-type sugar transport system, periplasmic component n=1 Tax=Actinoalloteichus hymeniacidonis TaxID=340345 RepID=A0AAC9HQP5_9PSEU|nr:sugar ABC transporter substrate-binding protein [Actinoalloteichus hymeniacidonis]AOS63506.1 ABC-type sugar transport system, periplasmic component [Actinoalloteichus hymeniacidonis]MBB5908450.1 multiple sugar transport system substrate-binding protein [Actinoalloteichus hymeniacidonis]
MHSSRERGKPLRSPTPGSFSRRNLLRGTGLGLLAAGGIGTLSACGSSRDDAALQWWDYIIEPERQAGVEALIAEIEQAHPDIRIERRVFPYADLQPALLRGAISGELPDIAVVDTVQVGILGGYGLLADLTEQVHRWGEATNYVPAAWDAGVIDDRILSIPNNSNCLALISNVDHLEEAGVEVPSDWAELATVGHALTTPEHRGLAVCATASEEGVFQFLPFLWQTGGDLADFDTSGAEALELQQQLVADGVLSGQAVGWTQQDVAGQFISGAASMMINGPWQLPTLRAAEDLRFRVDPLPAGQTRASCLGGEGWTVIAGSTKVDAAWRVIEYSQRREVLVPYLDTMGLLPARADLTDAGPWARDPELQIFLAELHHARPRAYGAAYPEISNEVSRAHQTVLSDPDADPAAVAADAFTRIAGDLP